MIKTISLIERESSDPYLLLALAIIHRAQVDVRQGPNKERIAAVEFFNSEWYEILFAYISISMPDCNLRETIYPVGISS